MLKNLIIVGAGGMIGTLLRFGVSQLVGKHGFPVATLLINIAGSFVIGIVFGAGFKNPEFETHWKLFLATGICGGFTTFSAFSFECLQLLQQQRFIAAGAYIFLSIIMGLCATFGGLQMTK